MTVSNDAEQSDQIRDIIQQLDTVFSDLSIYEQIVKIKMKHVLEDIVVTTPSVDVHKRLTERYFDVSELKKTNEGKVILKQINIILRAAFVLVLETRPEMQSLLWSDVDRLLENYPEFKDQDAIEKNYLLRFRNMMTLALVIVPGRLNKQLLVDIAARLEGSNKEYITGGGQKICVTRRVAIYHRESGVEAEKRPEKRVRVVDVPESDVVNKKRRTIYTPRKKVQSLVVDADLVKKVVRDPSALSDEEYSDDGQSIKQEEVPSSLRHWKVESSLQAKVDYLQQTDQNDRIPKVPRVPQLKSNALSQPCVNSRKKKIEVQPWHRLPEYGSNPQGLLAMATAQPFGSSLSSSNRASFSNLQVADVGSRPHSFSIYPKTAELSAQVQTNLDGQFYMPPSLQPTLYGGDSFSGIGSGFAWSTQNSFEDGGTLTFQNREMKEDAQAAELLSALKTPSFSLL